MKSIKLLPAYGRAANEKPKNLSPEIHQKLDHLCDRFEDSWQAGQSPGLDDFLRDGPADVQSEFFELSIRLELDYCRRRNERTTFDEYRQRHPEFVILRKEFQPAERDALTPVRQERLGSVEENERLTSPPSSKGSRWPRCRPRCG